MLHYLPLVDVVASAAMIGLTGGVSSTFTPLAGAALIEAYICFGSRGAAVSALGLSLSFLIGNASFDSQTIVGAFLRSLVLGGIAYALPKLSNSSSSNTSILEPRSLDTLDDHIDDLLDENRRLKATCRELTGAVRDQQLRSVTLALGQQILLAGSRDDANEDELYTRLLKGLADAVGAEAAVIWTLAEDGESLELRTTIGALAPNLDRSIIPIVSGMLPSDLRMECLNRLAAATPMATTLSLQIADDEFPVSHGEYASNGNLRASTTGVVLRSRDKVSGVVAFSSPHKEGFEPGAQKQLAEIVPIASLAVDHILQQGRNSRSMRELALLQELTNLMQQASSLDETYESVVKMLARIVPFDNCTIFIYDTLHKKLVPKASHGVVVNLIDHIPFEHGNGVSGWVAQNRKQIVVQDLVKETGLLNVELIPPRVRSFVSTPLYVQQSLIGVINLSHEAPNAFSSADVRLVSTLASQIAQAIERVEVVRSLEQMAITDGMTGLYNHRYFQMCLDNEMRRATRYDQPLTVMMLDIDHFKKINDRYGHGTGDYVLSEVSDVLRQSIRQTDVAARYGGDELIVIFPHTTAADATVAAERMRAAVQDREFICPNGSRLSLTVSIGVASYPTHASSREDLILQADTALYRAKKSGRNRVVADINLITLAKPEKDMEVHAVTVRPTQSRRASTKSPVKTA